jgi:hypothetical protein
MRLFGSLVALALLAPGPASARPRPVDPSSDPRAVPPREERDLTLLKRAGTPQPAAQAPVEPVEPGAAEPPPRPAPLIAAAIVAFGGALALAAISRRGKSSKPD